MRVSKLKTKGINRTTMDLVDEPSLWFAWDKSDSAAYWLAYYLASSVEDGRNGFIPGILHATRSINDGLSSPPTPKHGH